MREIIRMEANFIVLFFYRMTYLAFMILDTCIHSLFSEDKKSFLYIFIFQEQYLPYGRNKINANWVVTDINA